MVHTLISTLARWDTELFQRINSHHVVVLDRFFALFTQLGNGWVIGPLLVLIVVWRFHRQSLWPILLVSALAMTISGIANDTAKVEVNRSRPQLFFGGSESAPEHAYAVHVVGDTLHLNSFPSGHSNTAFSAAALLSVLFGGWFWLAYAAAALVAYSRIYVGAHFPFDTVAGGVLGMIVVYGVWGIALRLFGWKWNFKTGLRLLQKNGNRGHIT